MINGFTPKFASKSIIVGFFPPNSKIQGIKFSAAALATSFPFSGLPVNTIKSKGLVVI